VTVSREDVAHVARLAALALDEKSLGELTKQIGQILDYVSQLNDLAESTSDAGNGYPGPHALLREDVARRTHLELPLEEIAPAFRDGLFLVPRLGAVGDAPEAES
jgi:aspartyl-tRNA(Asn)/glutamyl-tRNA(Gln) amidotransferase subunit C